MGYTHYWTYNKSNNDAEQFAKAVEEIKKLLAAPHYLLKNISLCGVADNAVPILEDGVVFLNGVGNESHEDFYINVNEHEVGFCKTARKPYDLVVMLCLIAFANNLKRFTFSSNGDFNKEWLPARKLYEKEIRKIRKSVFKEE